MANQSLEEIGVGLAFIVGNILVADAIFGFSGFTDVQRIVEAAVGVGVVGTTVAIGLR